MTGVELQADAAAADRPSVLTHPAFPAIVALWLATLLGLGCLAVPIALFDRALAAGLSSVLPLGFATQRVIALGAGLAGAFAGWATVRHLAGKRTRPARLPRHPLGRGEQLGESAAGAAADAPPVQRRRTPGIVTGGGGDRPRAATEPPGLAELVDRLDASLPRREGAPVAGAEDRVRDATDGSGPGSPNTSAQRERSATDARLREALAALQEAGRSA